MPPPFGSHHVPEKKPIESIDYSKNSIYTTKWLDKEYIEE